MEVLCSRYSLGPFFFITKGRVVFRTGYRCDNPMIVGVHVIVPGSTLSEGEKYVVKVRGLSPLSFLFRMTILKMYIYVTLNNRLKLIIIILNIEYYIVFLSTATAKYCV